MPQTLLPPGYHTITPRIFVTDADGFIAFLRDVFGATGEQTSSAPAEMRIGDSLLIVSGTEYRQPMPACLYVYVDDADATHGRAVEAGAESLEEPKNVPYGDRRAMVKDPWGNIWQIATRLPYVCASRRGFGLMQKRH
jgi:PhnB protein